MGVLHLTWRSALPPAQERTLRSDPPSAYIGGVPKRTNFFQDIVALVHRHLAPEATIEESAMLVDRHTGFEAEVDVVMRQEVGGYSVTISVEAMSEARGATVEWVREMDSKHSQLETAQLVLVSAHGFSPQAESFARSKRILTICPEDLEDGNLTQTVLRDYDQLYPRTISSSIDHIRLRTAPPARQETVEFTPPANPQLFTAAGVELTALSDAAEATINAFMAEHMGGLLAQIPLDPGKVGITIETEGPSWTIQPAHFSKPEIPHLRADNRGEQVEELWPITAVSIDVTIEIRSEDPLVLTHKRFGDSAIVSFGPLELAGRRGVFVATDSKAGVETTFRERSADGFRDTPVSATPALTREDTPET